jgi:hypothetical protein
MPMDIRTFGGNDVVTTGGPKDRVAHNGDVQYDPTLQKNIVINTTPGPRIASFTLINADTDEVIAEFENLGEGMTLNLASLPTKNLNIRANVADGQKGSVAFEFDGHTNIENVAAYAMAGNDGGNADGTVAVRAPLRATNVPVQYPMLTETNYSLWAVKMKIIMRPLGVWSAVEGDAEYDEQKDEGAFAAISQSVPDSVMMAIAECDTAREAWEAIRRMRVGEDRVKKARVKQLKRQLDRMEMDDGESVTVFAQKLTTLVAEIR